MFRQLQHRIELYRLARRSDSHAILAFADCDCIESWPD